jgi:hypothetical protein
MMRWIIDSTSSEAIAFRANFDVYWYGALQPNSLFGGADRIGWRSTTDPNRDFAIGTSSYSEIQAFRDAVILDTGGTVDAFYNWHTWGASVGGKSFNLGWSPRDQNALTRVPAAQALIDTGATLFGETYGDISSTSAFTDSAWAVREFDAPVAVAPEVNQNGSTSLAAYETIGINWALMLQQVDADGYFFEGFAADAGSFTLTGGEVNFEVTSDGPVLLNAGSFTLTGGEVNFGAELATQLDAGSFTLTGGEVTFLATTTTTLDAGVFSLTGGAVSFNYDGERVYRINGVRI